MNLPFVLPLLTPGGVIMRLELALGRWVFYPFGIRFADMY